MKNDSFILLVDISGFTNFVNQTEIEHSGHIISELLETIIDADILGLSVAEVEGDAIFFYKEGVVPSLDDLQKQIQKTFIDFHYHIQLYEKRRVCHCGACSTAPNLTLKFVAHAGAYSFISVKGNRKPYGSDVILAHRLLKNDVPIKDYALFSNQLRRLWESQLDAANFIAQTTDYEDIGPVDYTYFKLGHLMDQVPEVEPLPKGYKSVKPIVSEVELDYPIEYVYQTLVSMDQRKEWIDGAEEVLYEAKDLNRLGSKHQCIVDGKIVNFEAVTNDFGSSKWVYGERTSSIPLVRESTSYFILDEVRDGATRLIVETHFKKHPLFGWLLTPLFRHFIKKGYKNSMVRLKDWMKQKAGQMKLS